MASKGRISFAKDDDIDENDVKTEFAQFKSSKNGHYTYSLIQVVCALVCISKIKS